jgi:hypothetical protein
MDPMSLQTFVVSQREELIKRTRAKVALRPSPQPTATELDHGVPLFLSQLANALADQEMEDKIPVGPTPTVRDNPTVTDKENATIGNSSRLHGQDLKRLGFTIEQVVHDYGDVCQAVTELALETKANITTSEFRTMNRCLDNAIAGAVTSWNEESERKAVESKSMVEALRTKLDTAIAAFNAFRDGHVGAGGATGTLLARCLIEMRVLVYDNEVTKVHGNKVKK